VFFLIAFIVGSEIIGTATVSVTVPTKHSLVLVLLLLAARLNRERAGIVLNIV
jgi:hypothetical protein